MNNTQKANRTPSQVSALGRQIYSVSDSSRLLLSGGEFTAAMGGLVLDFVSEPIDCADYELTLNAIMGGIDVYLPHYVKCEFNGFSFWGGRHIITGTQAWVHMKQSLLGYIHLPDQPPAFALETHSVRPVVMTFNMTAIMGGVTFYCL